MKIFLVTPASPASHQGNRTTALRWARLLGELGHSVEVAQEWNGQPCELLIALHARKSFVSIERFRRAHARAPLIVALTGTDLYADLAAGEEAKESLELATRLIVLQPLAADELSRTIREKARVIYQSAEPALRPDSSPEDFFQVCALIHLRQVKDPLVAAQAVRSLPEHSRIRLRHAGAAIDPEMAEEARAEERGNPRYRWLGDMPHEEAMQLLASSRLLVLTSKLEGGANVVSEALAASVPVLSTRIPGSIGLLGEDYTGYFPVGDALALRELLLRAEWDTGFYSELKSRCAALQPLFLPARERESWKSLLEELI